MIRRSACANPKHKLNPNANPHSKCQGQRWTLYHHLLIDASPVTFVAKHSAFETVGHATPVHITLVLNFVFDQSAIMTRSIIAPTYFYPGATNGWARVLTAAAYVSTVLINPNSGPGSQQIQDFATVAQQSQAAGMKVLGYVDSAYGTREVSDMQNEMVAYADWYRVDGFFIDDMYIAGKHYCKLYGASASLDVP